ncbi:MAG: UDP-N-acetylglucosamine 2-epimerase (non-hydrolyzing) [Candidatus Zixiibacteriota bacterium]
MTQKKKLIVSIVGARPQFIKLASLTPTISRKFNHVIVHSGQHYDLMMSDIFFQQLEIPKADYNLAVGSGNHGAMTGMIMSRFEALLMKLRPDMVLVYGDTNSTLSGALTAAKLQIPVGHVEAGLRSFRMDMPEEVNRRLTDHVARILFCPTAQAVKNLKNEGIRKEVILSGDLMYELIDHYREKITDNTGVLASFEVERQKYLLMTMHRAGNVDSYENIRQIVNILSELNRVVIFPIHPRTKKNLTRFGFSRKLKSLPHIKLVEPVSYLDNLSLINFAEAVLTDSGGIQKEAVALGTPCLTLRDETEWIETLNRGNHLVGLSEKKIMRNLKGLQRSGRKNSCKIRGRKPSEIITSTILSFFRDI